MPQSLTFEKRSARGHERARARGFDEVESPVILQTVEVATATVFETRSRGPRAERSCEGTHAVAASARGVDYESKGVREEARAHFMAYARRVVRRGVGGCDLLESPIFS